MMQNDILAKQNELILGSLYRVRGCLAVPNNQVLHKFNSRRACYKQHNAKSLRMILLKTSASGEKVESSFAHSTAKAVKADPRASGDAKLSPDALVLTISKTAVHIVMG